MSPITAIPPILFPPTSSFPSMSTPYSKRTFTFSKRSIEQASLRGVFLPWDWRGMHAIINGIIREVEEAREIQRNILVQVEWRESETLPKPFHLVCWLPRRYPAIDEQAPGYPANRRLATQLSAKSTTQEIGCVSKSNHSRSVLIGHEQRSIARVQKHVSYSPLHMGLTILPELTSQPNSIIIFTSVNRPLFTAYIKSPWGLYGYIRYGDMHKVKGIKWGW